MPQPINGLAWISASRTCEPGVNRKAHKKNPNPLPRTDKPTRKTIGVLGGVISTEGGLLNTSTFYVPPGALDSSVTISVRVETTLVREVFTLLRRLLAPSGLVTEFDFGPDGLRFNRPCTLTKKTGQPDGRLMTLWYFNPRTNSWERVDQAPSRNGEVSFPISHFSKYAIS